MEHFVTFDNVCKYYQMGENRIAAADHVTFHIEKGEFCIIVGPSGAGKTTVLNMLGGMDTCDEGHIWLDGKEVSAYNQRQLTEYRRYDVGFVFQFYNLVQNLTALENVELASEICKEPLPAAETLRQVGLEHRMGNFPAQLIQRNGIGAAPAAQIVQRFQNGEIRAAGSQDPAGLGDVPPAGQRHGYHDAGGDDKGIHPNSPVGRAHTGQSVLHPVYLCPYGQKRFRNVHETVQQDLRLRRDRDLICVHVTQKPKSIERSMSARL